MKYRDYIRSKEWQQVKKRYRASNLPQDCHVCGTRPVEMHHKTYKRLGSERLTDLLPLCRTCHQLVHDFCNHPRSAKGMTLWEAARRVRKYWKKHGRLPDLDGRFGLRQ